MLRKLYNWLFYNRKKQVAPVLSYYRYLKSKNLVIGANSDLSDFKLDIFGAVENNLNVQIGENCLIHGSIVLYSPHAKVKIGDGVFIGPDTTLFCYQDIEIQNDVMISWGCTIIDTNAHSLSSHERINDVAEWKKGWQYKNWDVVSNKPVKINSQCWIGFKSIITKGVILDTGCVVAAGSVVTKSFKAYSVVGGNPAEFIKHTN